MELQEGFPRYQWSKFTGDRLELYVVRSNDFVEFIEALENVKMLLPSDTAPPIVQVSPEPLPFPQPPSEKSEEEKEHLCPIHNEVMKLRIGKNGKTWRDHRWKDENDVWHQCNGKKERTQ